MLFLLLPIENRIKGDDPWEPWYDKAFGFVIRAVDEEEARRIANQNAGDENRGEFCDEKSAETTTPWLDPKYSTCKELSAAGESALILRDFAAA